MEKNVLMGERAKGRDLKAVTGQDSFSETPIYGFNVEETDDNPYLKNWAIGSTLCAVVADIRRTKNEDPDEQRDYACLETTDGVKFRVYTPGQLRSALERAGRGTYVEMTYMGKEKVKGFKSELHQFEVLAETPKNH